MKNVFNCYSVSSSIKRIKWVAAWCLHMPGTDMAPEQAFKKQNQFLHGEKTLLSGMVPASVEEPCQKSDLREISALVLPAEATPTMSTKLQMVRVNYLLILFFSRLNKARHSKQSMCLQIWSLQNNQLILKILVSSLWQSPQ